MVFGGMELRCIFAVPFAQRAGGHRGVEQLVARRAHNPKVVSSSLAPATKKTDPLLTGPFFISAGSLKNQGQSSPNKVRNSSKSAVPMTAFPSKS